MKAYRKLPILFVFSVIFFGCNKSIKIEGKAYNGIDSQILHIVDSMQILCLEEYPFITVCFTVCSENNIVITFREGVFTPPSPMPPAPIRETLISEMNDFIGYAQYKGIYLVFLNYLPEKYFGKFVKKDSLKIDESPFKKFGIYELDGKPIKDQVIEKRYFINENDSLMLYEGECMFDFPPIL